MAAAQKDGDPDDQSRTPLSWWLAVWWFALGLMVLNDHVLKGAGVLPGWLTGKLSDFAGLIMAPVLLTIITGARRPAGRAACFAIVVAPFVAIKISAVAARATEAAIGSLGIPWRLWTDPGDLLALGVLPLAWHIAAVRAGTRRALRVAQAPWTRRRDALGVVAGAVACLATSGPTPYPFRTAAFLANVSDETTTVEIFRARAPLDCAGLAPDPATALATAPFDPEACWTLGTGDMVPLSRNWVRLYLGTIVGGPGGPPPPCDAVIVRVQGQQELLLSWQAIGDVEVDAASINSAVCYDLDPHGMYLERLRDRIYLAPSLLITSQPIVFSSPEITGCATPDPTGIDGGVP